MAQSDGEGVGGVGGFGKLLQTKLGADHLLHLTFVGMPVACDTGFDLARGIAADGEAGLLRGEKDHAAHFGEAQGGAHIKGGEDRFYGHDLRLEFPDEAREKLVDVVKNSGGGGLLTLGGDFQGTVMEHAAGGVLHFDDGIAGGAGGGGIDAKNAKTIGGAG